MHRRTPYKHTVYPSFSSSTTSLTISRSLTLDICGISVLQSTHDTLALLDSMLGVAPIGFAFFDRGMRYVRVNETLAEAHGVSVPAHLGKRLRDLMPPGASLNVASDGDGPRAALNGH